MKEDAQNMGHSLQTQKDYIVNKNNEEPVKVKKPKRKLKIKE